MSEFNYGDPHPQGIDRRRRKFDSDKRTAEHFAKLLSDAELLYRRGHNGTVLGLRHFDLEEANIRWAQTWAHQHAGKDRGAAELCRHYADHGAYLIYLRLSAKERIKWQEAWADASRSLGDRRGEAYALANIALAYIEIGHARRALGLYQPVLAILRDIQDENGVASTLNNIGVAYKHLGDAHRAIGYHNDSLTMCGKVSDPELKANALMNIGLAYVDLEDSQRAISYYERALVIFRTIGNRLGEGQALGNLGLAYNNLGKPSKAIKFHEQNLVIAREIKDQRGENAVITNLGKAYNALGKARKAITYYEEALAISRNNGDRHGEGICLCGLAVAYAALRNNQRAIELSKQWLAIAHEIGDKLSEAYASANLSVWLSDLSQFDEGIHYCEHALSLFESLNNPNAKSIRDRLSRLRTKRELSDSELMPWWVRLKIPGFMTRTRVLWRVVTRLVGASALTLVSLWLWLASHHLLGVVVFLGPCIALSMLEGIWVLAAFRYIERRNRWKELWTSEYIESRQVFLPLCIMMLVDIILAFSIGFVLWVYLFLRT